MQKSSQPIGPTGRSDSGSYRGTEVFAAHVGGEVTSEELRVRTERARVTTGRTPAGESTTVDVGNCESADSDQRQFMADLVGDDYRHAADFSRAPSRHPNRISGEWDGVSG